MITDSPGPLIKALGDIDDQLQESMQDHADLAAKVKEGESFVKTYEGELFVQADGTDGQRRMRAKQLLHSDEHMVQLRLNQGLLAGYAVRYDYLESRRSIGQTILKTLRQEGFESGYGKGAPQRVDENG